MTAVQARRMHWTVAGVDAIIALRCWKLSGTLRGVLGASRSAPSGLMVDSPLHIPDVRALEASGNLLALEAASGRRSVQT